MGQYSRVLDVFAKVPAGWETVVSEKRPKCLLGMVGVDVHTKGIRALARMLREHGVEVVYVGEHNTPEAMIEAAVDEDADVIGVSFSTASYLALVDDLVAARADAGADGIDIMIGGLIHPDDEEALREKGVSGIFGPGTAMPDIIAYLDEIGRGSRV